MPTTVSQLCNTQRGTPPRSQGGTIHAQPHLNDMLPGWVGDDDFPLEDLKASCLAAMELQTEMAFDRGWLDTELPTYRVPDPDELLEDTSCQ